MPDLRRGEDTFRDKLAHTTEVVLRGTVSQYESRSQRTLPAIFLSRDAALALLEACPERGDRPAANWRPDVGDDLALRVVERREGGGPTVVENVCGLWPGSDPELRDEVLLISAHYDHVGARDGEVWNGADDNGSGSMGLLALAEGLRAFGPMRRSVMLMWVSGEEKGLWGSEAWARAPVLPAVLPGARAVCALNIDMIGRNRADELMITPTRHHRSYNGLTRLAEELAPAEGFERLGSCDEFWDRSDHASFSQHLRLPVAFLFAGIHEDYHEPTDTADKIDFDKVRRVVRLVLRMLDGMQADTLELAG